MFKRLEDARRFMIDWLDRNPDSYIEYFDICSGSNFSDPDGLEVWGGQGGYFYNVVNSSYKDHQQFTYREMSKIERRSGYKFIFRNKQNININNKTN